MRWDRRVTRDTRVWSWDEGFVVNGTFGADCIGDRSLGGMRGYICAWYVGELDWASKYGVRYAYGENERARRIDRARPEHDRLQLMSRLGPQGVSWARVEEDRNSWPRPWSGEFPWSTWGPG